MSIQIKLKNSVVQDSTPSASDLPEVGELAVNGNINSIGGFMRASDNSIVKIFGPGSVTTPTATTTVSGISELATNSETTTGTATNRVVTPAGLNAVTVAERTTSNTNYVAKAGSTLTGVLTMPNGSNSAPAINFGDSDSGIFGGTNTVSLAAGGTTRLTADTGVSVVGTLAVTGAITSTSDLTIPDKIIHSGDTNTAIRFPAADTVSVETGGSEAFRVDSGQRLLVGASSARTNLKDVAANNVTPSFLFEKANDDAIKDLAIIYGRGNVTGPNLLLGKHRATTIGGTTVVQDNDELGGVGFLGSDGTTFRVAASVRGFSDGTPGASDMPGRLVFSTTADGAASPTERLRIDSSGNVGIGESASIDARLHVNSGTDNASLFIESTDSDVNLCMADNAGSCRLLQSAGDLHFRTGGNANAFGTGDSEKMVIHSSGSVGINNTSPSSYNASADNLVIGVSGDTGITVASGASSQGSLFFADGTSGSAVAEGFLAYIHSSNYMMFGTSNTERMRIDASGNVSVGGTSPSTQSAKFQTRGTSQNATRINMHHEGNSSASISANGGLVFGSDTANGTTQRMVLDTSGRLLLGTTTEGHANSDDLTIAGSGDTGITIRSGTSSAGQIFFSDATSGNAEFAGFIQYLHNQNSLNLGTDETTRMTINNSGNVGIGTTSPDNTLHLVYSDSQTYNTDIRNAGLQIENNDGTDNTYAQLHLRAGNSDVYLRAIREGSNLTSLAFLTDNGGSTSDAGEAMRIHSSGRVFIGATNPAASANADDLCIGNNDGSGETGITLGSNTASSIRWADGASNSAAVIEFEHGSTNALKFMSEGSELMRLNSSGRLLAGSTTTANNGRIQGFIAHGSTAGESGITSVDTTSMAAGVGGEIAFYGKTSSSGYNYLGHVRGIKENGTDTNTACALTFHTRPTLTAPQERMRITSDGKVGIGTATPGTLLSLSGGGNTALSINTGNNNGDNSTINFGDSADGNAGFINYDHGTNVMQFSVAGERMVINSAGNIGIGGSAPNYQLHVVSNMAVGGHGFAQQLTFSSTAIQSLLLGTGYRNMSLNALGGSVGIGTTTPESNLEVKGTSTTLGGVGNSTTVCGGKITVSDPDGRKAAFFAPRTSDAGIGTITNHVMTFLVSNTEKARMMSTNQSDPAFLIGTSTNSLGTSSFGTAIFYEGSLVVSRNVTGSNAVVYFGGTQGNANVQGDGDLINTNNSYGQISDETLKQDIVDAGSQWNDIKALRVRKFRFKSNPTGALQIGVVAQEVETVSAGLVSESNTDIKSGAGEKVKSVKYSVLYMKAVKCLQEAMAKIEVLETKVAALEAA